MVGSHNKSSAMILCDRSRCQLDTSLTFRGQSMLPLLRDGAVLTCRSSETVRVGDIVVFWRVDRLVVHRVVDIYSQNTRKFYVEKGDNALAYSILKWDDMLAKVIAINGEKNWLPHSSYTCFANYIVAKISYAIAVVSPIVTMIPRRLFKQYRFSKLYIRTWIRFGNWVSRHFALLLLGFSSSTPLNKG